MNVKFCYLLPAFIWAISLAGCASKTALETSSAPLHVQKLDKSALKATGSENQARALPAHKAQLAFYQAPKTWQASNLTAKSAPNTHAPCVTEGPIAKNNLPLPSQAYPQGGIACLRIVP